MADGNNEETQMFYLQYFTMWYINFEEFIKFWLYLATLISWKRNFIFTQEAENVCTDENNNTVLENSFGIMYKSAII